MAQKKASGFAAVSQLFSERWPSTPSGRSFLSPPIERNIDFELDVRVEIDSGKCVLHPTPSQPEHEEVSFKRYAPVCLYDHCRHTPEMRYAKTWVVTEERRSNE